MIINRWLGERVSCIPGIRQELLPADRPYDPDWIVSRVLWDSGNRLYWTHGTLRRSGERFCWGHIGRETPFSWRYDLTGATYEIGRHETPSEARTRHFAQQRAAS